MLKKIIYDFVILKIFLLALATIFLTQHILVELSFAQTSTSLSLSHSNNENIVIQPVTLTQNAEKPNTSTAMPDVTSNISLIITPDIVNPLDNEDPSSSNEMTQTNANDNSATK